MVTLNNLKPSVGSHRISKRLGRGPGSNKGGTCGHGNNGHKARSGSTYKPYFEGGQTPMSRRIPKRGFNNYSRIEYSVVNLNDLQKIETNEKEITIDFMLVNGFIGSKNNPVKILGDGDYNRNFTIKANAFSKSAKEKIEKAKGKAEVVARV